MFKFGFPYLRRGTTECKIVHMITIDDHTNCLMPMGVKECNLMIQLNSVRLRLEVQDVSNFGVHHSSTLNCTCLWFCPSLTK